MRLNDLNQLLDVGLAQRCCSSKPQVSKSSGVRGRRIVYSDSGKKKEKENLSPIGDKNEHILLILIIKSNILVAPAHAHPLTDEFGAQF
jgi:hypothetical protein